jgi:hypothetical protein
MKKNYLYTINLLIIFMLLSGCAQGSTTPDAANGQAGLDVTSGAYPAQAAEYPAPYPDSQIIQQTAQIENPQPEYPWPGSPEQALTGASLSIPDPKPDSAVIVGILSENGKPLANATIYLADVLQDDDTGEFQVASYSRETSPRATVDQNGQFVFADIKPGKYSLIVDNFSTYFSLFEPADSEKPLIFSVEPGKTTDLGALDYEDLPEL